MSDPKSKSPDAPSSITATLAEVLERRKAALVQSGKGAPRGGAMRQFERAAAARSASKSKPALRK